MGNAATKAKEATSKAREAHTQHKSKPKNTKSVQQQKIQTAKATGVLALPERKLKHVPAEVLELTALRTLDLSQNRLEELPLEIARLTSLKILKLQSNALTTLPDLSALTALTTVRLSCS
jgi:Leucine-rich repeat (LRR) protein